MPRTAAVESPRPKKKHQVITLRLPDDVKHILHNHCLHESEKLDRNVSYNSAIISMIKKQARR